LTLRGGRQNTKLRRDATAIFRAALEAADPRRAVERHVRIEGETLIAGRARFRLRQYDKIYVVGAGKAGASMAVAVERLLGNRIAGGLINVKYGYVAKLRRIELNQCGHPEPDANGLAGARRILDIATNAGSHDLVMCLISGGASALLPLPPPPLTLEDKRGVTRLLLDSGADIHEINTVRKHLSLIKGGQLARAAFPATVVTLILSDVIGDDLDVIGSGPTVPDRSTFADARAILDNYALWDRAPKAVAERLRTVRDETPKPGDAVFKRVTNLIVGSNRLAVDAAAAQARKLRYRTLVLSTFIEGETRDVARMHAALVKETLTSNRPAKRPACLISGGETTVTIRGAGKGGRNQEFALAAAIDIAGCRDAVILSAGTDGTDGPTDAAGAVADGDTITRAQAQGLDAAAHLARNDSYPFFETLGDLLITGPTNTNVMDIHVALIA
jgi:glycerate 2-kinase